MLTKEEADKLIDTLIELTQIHPEDERCVKSKEIFSLIYKFTEKPKREIQVGDIYEDGHGHLITITNIREEYDFPIIATPLSSQGAPCGCRSVNYSYNSRGEFMEGVKTRNLILSTPYKLVEIEE